MINRLKHPALVLVSAVILSATLLVGPQPAALACPFCSAPSLTLTEQLAQSDAAVLVKWTGGTEAEGDEAGSTNYQILDVLRDVTNGVKKGDTIRLPRYRAGKVGDLFVLMGSKAAVIEWGSPLEVTETSYKYIAEAPSPESKPEERLVYFVNFLESPDVMIANDAYAEFANAPYKFIVPISKQLPAKKIRGWVSDPETVPTRLGLYGLLLGLCGEADDIELMKRKITEPSEDFRLGIDGVMAGYLLLSGEKGLKLIDDTKLKDKSVPFSETYAAMQALRFMWTYAEGRIPPDRLRQSMRILLDRPELADLVIADLARWQDWTVQDQLMKLYGADQYDIPSIKRAIVRYMLVCSKDAPDETTGETAEVPAHVKQAKKYLAELRNKDPKTVSEAERFFFLR